MQQLRKTLIAFLILFFTAMGAAQGFSFDFGDDDDDYRFRGYPYWGNAFNPWFAPSPHYYYPQGYYYPRRPSSIERSTMVRERQQVMDTHGDTLEQLGELLYGDSGFDRAQAIKLALKIEVASGLALTDNFHPSTVTTTGSETGPALWGNPQTFKANALALQTAAKDLANELQKQPTAEEGAVYLPKRSRSFAREEPETVPVSPGIWKKFNNMSNICANCHREYRGASW